MTEYIPSTRAEALLFGFTTYNTGKPCRHGHDSRRYARDGKCSACCIERAAIWKAANPDAERKSYVHHREKRLVKAKAYREANHDSVHQTKMRWQRANSEKLNEKRRLRNPLKPKRAPFDNNEYFRKRRQNDVNFKMATYMRNMVGRVLRMSGNNKSRKTFELLGYEPRDLIAHLEGQFSEGMTWGNYGEWHIDHKIPLKSLITLGVTDPAITNALWNLQPMWASENIAKGDRYVSPL